MVEQLVSFIYAEHDVRVADIDHEYHAPPPFFSFRSRLMSSDCTDEVSAPTEMMSTPVSAISRTVSRVTPPEASMTMCGARGSNHPRPPPSSRSGLIVVQHDDVRASRERRFDHCSSDFRLHFDLHRMRDVRPRRSDRRRDAAGRLNMVVLDHAPRRTGRNGGSARRRRAPRISPARDGRASSCAYRRGVPAARPAVDETRASGSRCPTSAAAN